MPNYNATSITTTMLRVVSYTHTLSLLYYTHNHYYYATRTITTTMLHTSSLLYIISNTMLHTPSLLLCYTHHSTHTITTTILHTASLLLYYTSTFVFSECSSSTLLTLGNGPNFSLMSNEFNPISFLMYGSAPAFNSNVTISTSPLLAA